MSYTPTTWTNGDVITAEKLNKIENGLSPEVFTADIGGNLDDGYYIVTPMSTIREQVLAGKKINFNIEDFEYNPDDPVPWVVGLCTEYSIGFYQLQLDIGSKKQLRCVYIFINENSVSIDWFYVGS